MPPQTDDWKTETERNLTKKDLILFYLIKKFKTYNKDLTLFHCAGLYAPPCICS